LAEHLPPLSTLPNKALQLTPNSWPRSERGGILAAAAQPRRWRSALFGAAERRSVGRREMKQCTIILAFLLALWPTACSRWFSVVPGGSLDSTVRFEFHESLDQEKSRLRIVEFSVFLVHDAAVQPPPLWSLSGVARVDRIDYGVPPEGLKQLAEPPPLLPGQVYFVQAGDKPIFNSIPGHASSFFAVTNDGVVQDCERSECAFIAARAQGAAPPNKALQLTSHSAFQSTSGRIRH